MLTRRDGAPLAGYVSDGEGPVLVLANGLGGPVAAFRHQLTHFKTRFRVLTWDYRGLYASTAARPPERVDVAAQADDLEDLMTAVGARDAVLVGWSMGVQVVLELCARSPERASHIVLISGTSGRPLESTLLPGGSFWLPGLVARAEAYHALGSRVIARLAASRTAVDLLRRSGLVSPRLGADELLEIAREFKSIDFQVYFRTLGELAKHDSSADLARVTARALVVSGARDPVFPPGVAQKLVNRLKHSELYVVPNATHYAPVEYPELVNARIDRFLSEAFGERGLTVPTTGGKDRPVP
jgi:3-oxoadipate enol-lactonase